jgi:hypothetical protein
MEKAFPDSFPLPLVIPLAEKRHITGKEEKREDNFGRLVLFVYFCEGKQ